jgi:hypothetical protein
MGLWTLSALQLTDPDYQSYFLEVKGRDGPLDFSTVLTDGEPKYGSRTLTATLESSEGNRLERRARISRMINDLDGRRMDIQHPDFPEHYLTGRVQVKEVYNDLAHCAVEVTATCDPWLYAIAERAYVLTAATDNQTAVLANHGRRTLVPKVTVTGDGASFLIESGAYSVALGPGTYDLPDLLLKTGNTPIMYSGSGVARITYREAVLR